MQNTATINISLPIRLKAQADDLVAKGYFVSFSDVVRSAVRNLLNHSSYDMLLYKAKEEEKKGESVILSNDDEIDSFMAKV